MNPRLFLFATAAGFASAALFGLAMMRVAPQHSSLGAVLPAIALAIGIFVMGVRYPRAIATGCSACGHARDASLAFCGACGRV